MKHKMSIPLQKEILKSLTEQSNGDLLTGQIAVIYNDQRQSIAARFYERDVVSRAKSRKLKDNDTCFISRAGETSSIPPDDVMMGIFSWKKLADKEIKLATES
mgnify:CR=1 FL=1